MFAGPLGIEATMTTTNTSYKFVRIEKDYIELVIVDEFEQGVSDYMNIAWKEKHSRFELFKSR